MKRSPGKNIKIFLEGGLFSTGSEPEDTTVTGFLSDALGGDASDTVHWKFWNQENFLGGLIWNEAQYLMTSKTECHDVPLMQVLPST